LYGDYPEIYEPDRHYPIGRLPGYEKDRVRWLNTFSVGVRQYGMLDIGAIINYDSPLTFSYAAPVPRTAQQTAAVTDSTGKRIYNSTPTSTTVFFGQRGAGQFASSKSLDLALTYSLPLFGSRFSTWVKGEMTNVTNQHTKTNWVTTLVADPGAPKDALGLPSPGTGADGKDHTGYLKCGLPNPYVDGNPIVTAGCGGVVFGNPLNAFYAPNGYQPARTWDFSLGLRF